VGRGRCTGGNVFDRRDSSEKQCESLFVAGRATIKFSKSPGDYLPVVFTRWEGTELMNYSPFIYAFEQTNIAITGEGTLDGQSWQRLMVAMERTRKIRLERRDSQINVPIERRYRTWQSRVCP
jgi:hypothetical protein